MRKLSKFWLIGAPVWLACAGRGATEIPKVESEDGGSNSVLSEGGAAMVASGPGSGGLPSSRTVTVSDEESTPVPSYSRECLQAALQRPSFTSTGAAGEAGTIASDVIAAAGAPGTNVSAADLGLGGGDLTVLVLFDQSGSMGSGWDERTKWQVANEALMTAVEPVLDLVTIGTIFFPQPEGCNVAPLDSGQQIDFMSGRNFRSHWEATAESRGPNGSTPLGQAIQLADMAIENACQLGLLERRFRVVIVTDGEPNCGVDVESLPVLPAEWRRLGVETRVMGLPGSQGALDLMDRIARAGGTEKCLSLGTPQQMQSEMKAALM